jgi:L-2-hydroxyglutarate oxidase LhgO
MLTASLLAHAKEHGALFETRAALKGARQGADGWELSTSRGPLKAQRVVNAAGLFADEVASFFGAASPTVYPCRGDYFRWQTKTHFKHLLYPVKKSSARGLGVHLTLELDGGIKLGPDAQYVHSKTDFGPADDKRDAFLGAAERLVGTIEPGQLRWDSCGIRPKMRGPDDTGEKDFLILEEPAGVIHMLGIESPGLTAALALAEEVSGRL